MTTLLAIGASVAYGLSDFYAGVLARRMPTVLIALWSQVVGLITLGIAAWLSDQRFDVDGFAWGLGGGVVAAAGLLVFYRALAIGPASVAAPVSAAGTLVPVAASIVSATHHRPRPSWACRSPSSGSRWSPEATPKTTSSRHSRASDPGWW